VMFMHGGLSNSDYWGLQVEAVLKKGYKVVVLDSRTHGRSGRDENELGYDLMADDCKLVSIWITTDSLI
jgi:pimeloyl-ACP methyl ester carboxylesterase